MRVVRPVLNVLSVLLLIVGAWVVGKAVFQFVASMLHAVPFAALGKGLADFFEGEKPAVWLTALATAALYWATRALSRATNIQLAVDGPLLNVGLQSAPPTDATSLSPYADEWAEVDRTSALAPWVTGDHENYVYLVVSNLQTKPIGIAGAIDIKIALYFGANDAPNHPFVIRRNVRQEVLPPQTYVVGPVLNIGSLGAFMAAVESVEYRDINKRRRTAAWGSNILAIGTSGLSTGYKIFEPRKGEFTDGHRG